MAQGIEIFYDGQCPFCSAYVRMLHLRRAAGQVTLIDARSSDPRVARLRAAGADFEEGMAVRHGERIYCGADAVTLLAVLSEPGGWMRALLRSPRRAAILYPALRAGRRLALRMMGRAPIR